MLRKERTDEEWKEDVASVRRCFDEEFDEKPDFLPMVPWYSGTSADMYKTMFDLLISVKLFLGRYDMRTMQVDLWVQCIMFASCSFWSPSFLSDPF